MTLLRYGSASDVGRVRSTNQDAKLTTDRVMAVADGMGGHQGGEVASRLAVEALDEFFLHPTTYGLIEAVNHANAAVFERSSDDPDLRGMGTTLVAIAPVDADGDGTEETIAWVNVGDSRLYLFRDGDLTQVSDDHSLVEEAVRAGQLTPEEATQHPQRHILTRALGISEDVAADHDTVDVFEGDRLLLCSDGLFNEVEEPRIAATLRRLADPDEAARELVRQAIDHGGRDNITVVIVDVVDDGGKAVKAAAALPTEPAAVESEAGTVVEPETAQADASQAAAAPAAEPTLTETPAPKRTRARRLTWRVVGFAVVLLVVLGGAVAAIGFYARQTYFVGFQADDVAIFRGKPDGVLWFDPTFEEATTLHKVDVPRNRVDQITAGAEFSDLDAARRFVENIQDEAAEQRGGTTTTSTTSPTTTSPTTTTQPGATTTTGAGPP